MPAHGIVFERLLDLYNRQAPIDVAVLGEELKTAKQLDAVGGYAFLTRVSGSIPTTAQAGYFIDRVREQHLLREIIRSATGAVEDCFNFTGGIDEFVDQVEHEDLRGHPEPGERGREAHARAHEGGDERRPQDDDEEGRDDGRARRASTTWTASRSASSARR